MPKKECKNGLINEWAAHQNNYNKSYLYAYYFIIMAILLAYKVREKIDF